jgi:hypothetical protein
MEENTSQSKKWVLIGMAGAVVVLSVAGTFIPNAREYIISIVKMLLGAIPGIAL